ncbi:globin domain-containing protein [Lentzea sp. NBC_00516]|uniref:nitric oxide dioxygenase n=1 Tax=Lentzea sokolovensis TaxID=3095429 RepID=A0ABU4UPN7_9PSEU|nr:MULTISPECIES: globin domain-containing protein [unclassified Lentzea]MDX8141460.1 globin domain-containing protein [Lentzea sp. BCCO 10_0061]WUD27282.1 globin domain-containing protein [Lentzea sp. NBC_00516]
MLSAASAAVVRATLPVVRDHAAEITAEFYPSMFAAHPELLNLFNRGNQASGKQQIALAAAVVAYAQHLLDGTPFGPIAERIAHKHVSLGVRSDQYPIVGKHLIGAVATVLGDAVTPEVAAAWDEVYWLFAVTLIAAEAGLYQQAGVSPATVWRPWRIAKRDEEAVDTVSFTLLPDDGGPVPAFEPGQYVSIAVDLPDGHRQPRQYSLSQSSGRGELRITVRRVRGADGAPDGAVSNFLHDNVHADDTVLVGPPAGEVTLEPGDRPVVLISAGIGITPMLSMLDQLAATQPARPVVAVHAETSPDRHAHRAEYARLAGFQQLTWYENGGDGGQPGLVDVNTIPLPPNAIAYLCGPITFMRDMRAGLLRRGVHADDIRYEVFGPGMLDN